MQSINEVLHRLEQIIQWAKENESPSGYFAAIYYKMTKAIADGILSGEFENGERMEQLDIRFAKRYFDAYDQWQGGNRPTQSWEHAFEASKQENLTVIQHILLGINAHINLDLGIAAAQTRPGNAIGELKNDFNKVNDIIAGLTDGVQDRLANIWLPFTWLDYLLKTEDEGWINFSINTSRRVAWETATVLAFNPDAQLENTIIDSIDQNIASVAQKVMNPGLVVQSGLYLVKKYEKGSVKDKIEALIS